MQRLPIKSSLLMSTYASPKRNYCAIISSVLCTLAGVCPQLSKCVVSQSYGNVFVTLSNSQELRKRSWESLTAVFFMGTTVKSVDLLIFISVGSGSPTCQRPAVTLNATLLLSVTDSKPTLYLCFLSFSKFTSTHAS